MNDNNINLLVLELDEYEYPTESTLEQIQSFNGSHEKLMEEIEFLFGKYGKLERDGNTWKVCTGGWSGCENVIYALKKNKLFWHSCWVMSKRGGYYEFETKQRDYTKDDIDETK